MSPLNAWPFTEAQQLTEKVKDKSKTVIFETGYGPSGLPHIGTFAEVARTTWVRHAFEYMTQRATRLIAFSDDMDGLRKVPLNVPQREMLAGTGLFGVPAAEEFMPGVECAECHMPQTSEEDRLATLCFFGDRLITSKAL